MTVTVVQGDAADLPLPDKSADVVFTSPPYFAQRDYTDAGVSLRGQVGAENTPVAYLAALLRCTEEWLRVLKPEGSLFVNLGDKYSGYYGPNWQVGRNPGGGERKDRDYRDDMPVSAPSLWGVPNKSLIGLPWKYALACMEAGLILRQDIVWAKPNGMPEGKMRDRAIHSHEYLFHFTKKARYYYNPEADVHKLRSVWNIPVGRGYTGSNGKHHATFPEQLVKPAVEGWCPSGGTVLDPMGGTGTTAVVADRTGRHGISVDLSGSYSQVARERTGR